MQPPKSRIAPGCTRSAPIWGHYYHFHIRIACPKGSTNCEAQPPVRNDDGCGAELDRWLALIKNPPKPSPVPPAPEKAPITLSQLPPDCGSVLANGQAPAPAAKQAPAKQAAPAGKKATVTK